LLFCKEALCIDYTHRWVDDHSKKSSDFCNDSSPTETTSCLEEVECVNCNSIRCLFFVEMANFESLGPLIRPSA
jgi:hypothetical protein